MGKKYGPTPQSLKGRGSEKTRHKRVRVKNTPPSKKVTPAMNAGKKPK